MVKPGPILQISKALYDFPSAGDTIATPVTVVWND